MCVCVCVCVHGVGRRGEYECMCVNVCVCVCVSGIPCRTRPGRWSRAPASAPARCCSPHRCTHVRRSSQCEFSSSVNSCFMSANLGSTSDQCEMQPLPTWLLFCLEQ